MRSVVSNDTANAAAESTPYEGVDAAEWQSMVERGSAAGVLQADDIAHVLRKVELTGDVLQEVESRLGGLGITIDDQIDDLTPTEGIERPVLVRRLMSDVDERKFVVGLFRYILSGSGELAPVCWSMCVAPKMVLIRVASSHS
jgi:hypothetical protein